MKKQFFRVKQLADQTFSRAGKSEYLTDEMAAAERKVEQLRAALQLVGKRLGAGGGGGGGGGGGATQDAAAREKRLRKLPEYALGLSMCEASNYDDDDASVLKYILYECGKTEKYLANEIAEHELKVEQLVCAPLNVISEQDLPAIVKSKKQLAKLMAEKESASSRYQHQVRQIEQNPGKLSAAREEMEEAAARVATHRDALAADMFALVAKEAQLAHTLLQYVKLQRAYHESALHSLQDTVPELERFINDSAVKPVFGYPLEEHLRVTGRVVAFPLELCACALHELGLHEEGLFRIAGGSSRVRRMKLSLDAGLFSAPLPHEYHDVHVVASVLKGYLRELPEPLLTYRLYETFVAAARPAAEQARLNALWDAVHRLPEANYNNLRYLVKFLATLTQNQASNKMTASNLAIVIAPNLLWPADDAFDMNLTAAINCVVELLIKHADWFFRDDINFFLTFSKEELLPDHCEYGFSPSFGQLAHTAAVSEQSNGDHAIKTHSRSSSHDTSLILLDGEMKKAQSNSSLSDQSSPPHGSPKPIIRRKNKPLAPVPPNFTPDKNKKPETANVANKTPAVCQEKTNKTESTSDDKNKIVNKFDFEKPGKPPRPVISDTGKVITGVQTINRSTYKQNKALREELSGKSASRESLNEIRRQSLDFDKGGPDNVADGSASDKETTLVVKSVIAQSGVVARMKVLGDNYPGGTRSSATPPPRPVAAPRTIPPAGGAGDVELAGEVQLRHKPAVPERPAALRPQSFRHPHHRNSVAEAPAAAPAASPASTADPAQLERAHVYSVDKQQPTVVRVGGVAATEAAGDEDDEGEGARVTVQRTHSSGGRKPSDGDEPQSLSSQSRLSQSEGSITEAPTSPRGLRSRPPRPQVPAPPPPAAAASAASAAPPAAESTDL